jgi:hypothetical protein
MKFVDDVPDDRLALARQVLIQPIDQFGTRHFPEISGTQTNDESLFTRYYRRNRRTITAVLESKKEITASHVVAPQFLSSYPPRALFARAQRRRPHKK